MAHFSAKVIVRYKQKRMCYPENVSPIRQRAINMLYFGWSMTLILLSAWIIERWVKFYGGLSGCGIIANLNIVSHPAQRYYPVLLLCLYWPMYALSPSPLSVVQSFHKYFYAWWASSAWKLLNCPTKNTIIILDIPTHIFTHWKPHYCGCTLFCKCELMPHKTGWTWHWGAKAGRTSLARVKNQIKSMHYRISSTSR